MKKVKIFTSGRINFIGEHVDYINGISISSTIDLFTEIEIILNEKPFNNNNNKTNLNKNFKIRVYSSYFDETVFIDPLSFEIISFSGKYQDRENKGVFEKNNKITIEIKNSIDNKNIFSNNWFNYIIAVLKYFKENGFTINFHHIININGNLPMSSGLSSSASLIIGLISGYNKILNLNLSNKNIIDSAKFIENQYLNSPCGYLDQYSIVYGKENTLLFIDFYNHNIEYLKIDKYLKNIKHKFSIFVIDSNFKHSIASGEYGNRIIEKNKIENYIKQKYKLSIREFIEFLIKKYSLLKIQNSNLTKSAVFDNSYSESHFQTLKKIIEKENLFTENKFPDLILKKRFIHFLGELLRVYRFKQFIITNNPDNAFNLLYLSHQSLKEYYEVSIPQIDFIVSYLSKHKNIFSGARMIGGGFGGSVLTVVKEKSINQALKLIEILKEKYRYQYKINLNIYKTSPAKGISIL